MDSSISSNDDDNIESQLSKTQRLELAYKETLRNTDLIIKEEGARRLRLRILMLETENDELHEQLSAGYDRIDVLEQDSEDLSAQFANAQEQISQLEAQIRTQTRELSNLKAELKSMNGVTSDSAKILTEKLALTRELATLKPELEHLRSQATYQQTVLAEKLALERQVSTLEVELEAEKRASKRAAKKNNNQERETELQIQVDELQKDLAREKRERMKARKDADAEFQSQIEELQKELARERLDKKKAREGVENDLQKQVESLRHDLAREKREGEQARTELEADLRSQLEKLEKDLAREKRENTKARKNVDSELHEQIESLQQDLAREKKENEKARKELKKIRNNTDVEEKLESLQQELAQEKKLSEKARKDADSDLNDQLESLQQDLEREKMEAEKAHKEAEKDRKNLEGQQAILESKLDQIRTKFRSTKEELKECQTELAEAKAGVTKASRANVNGKAPAKIPRKRGVSELDDDVAIGTPDGVAVRGKRQMAKKGRAEQTMVGEKSMFSITPFLNRTISMAPDTSGEEDESEDDKPQRFAKASGGSVQEKLAVAASSISNSDPAPAPKPRGRKKAADKPTADVLGEAKPNAKAKKPTAKKDVRTISTLEKVTEEEGDENEQPSDGTPPMKVFTGNDFAKPAPVQAAKVAKPTVSDDGAKKKKRKLGDGKTLFDEEDGEVTKRPAKVTLGAPRLLTKGGLAGPKDGLKGGLGSAGVFGGFSPLKKDRRGIGASFLG